MLKTLILLIALFFTFTTNAAASGDSWFDVGRALGSSIGNGPSGTDDKDFYLEKSFNFSKVKKVCVITTVPNNFSQYVSDPYIANKYLDIIQKEFEDMPVELKSLDQIYTDFNKLPTTAVIPQDNQPQAFVNYIITNYDAQLFVQIFAYRQKYGNVGDVYLDFRLWDNNAKKDVMYYKDMRLDAPRSWKEGMIKRITGQFKNKLENAIEETSSKEKLNKSDQ